MSGNKLSQVRFSSLRAMKKTFNWFGVEIVRAKNVPKLTFLGLKQKPIRTIIDIGANGGQFAKYISPIFPAAKLYCFEPLPDPYKELHSWAAQQGGRVAPINLALGAENSMIKMMLHDEHSQSSSMLPTTKLANKLYPMTSRQSEIIVQQKTLDDALHDEDLKGHVLIKMDVQGYEDRVISGGLKTFSRAHACITEISLDTLYEGQATFSKLISVLGGIGFHYAGNISQTYGDDGHCIYLDALFIRKEEASDGLVG